MHRKTTINSITIYQIILLVNVFHYPLATCASHPPPKASLDQGSRALSKLKTLADPKEIHLSRVPDYLAVYLTINANLLKPADEPL